VVAEVSKASKVSGPLEMHSEVNLDFETSRKEQSTEHPQQLSVHTFPSLPSFSKPKLQSMEQLSNQSDLYLTVVHKTSAAEPENPRKLADKHYLFEDWKVAKFGGLICTNEAMIN